MRRPLIIILLFCFSTLANAQKPVLISGTFDSIPAEKFLRQIEEQTPYFFYFNKVQLDSIYVNLEAKNLSIQDVLTKAFTNTDIQFSVDSRNRFFITKKIAVITSLPANLFNRNGQDETDQVQSILTGNFSGDRKTTVSDNKIYEVGIKTNTIKQGNVTVNGYIRNQKTGEPVTKAAILVDSLNKNILSDNYGYYTVTIPAGRYTWNLQSLGMEDSKLNVIIYSDGSLNFEMKERVALLKEVVVSAQKVANVNRLQLGLEQLSIESIKKIPAVFGEADLLRAVMTLPGVKTVGEASTGLNVRGGSADQNLVLMNGTTIYNPSHFFGMFSAFNPEIVKDIELYKSSIPAKFGGRLSSVLDIGLREGNKKTITGSAGIGIITSRANIEGPLIKDRSSFIIGGRSTYANWVLNLLPDRYKRSKASFYDINLGITHHFNNNNDLYITAYSSADKFNLANDTTYAYSNLNFNMRWKHHFNNKLLGYFSAGNDNYKYSVESTENKVNAYTLKFDIHQLNFRSDFSYVANSNHTFEFGVNTIRYKLHPGSFLPNGEESLVAPDIVSPEQAQESAFYLSDRFTLSSKFSLTGGIRYSMFNYLGANTINYYAAGLPKNDANVVDTRTYSAGKIINTYKGPEYRFALRYAFSPSFSMKAGFNSQRQYIHMLSNTTAIAPTDIWKLSDPNIKPQRGNQVSLGVYKNLKSNTIETSAEVYYKKIQDYLDYRPGARLVLNHNIEREVINTRGKAYGFELMIKKTSGKLNGWISYTYSRILLQADDSTLANIVNGGNWYPANYDKPHDVTAIGNFKINHRFSFSMNFTYSTGRPITLPVGRFYYAGSQRMLYADRNSYRIPDYFRADFSMNIDGNHKVNQKTHNWWTIGVYNLTGRKNPFSVYYVSEGGVVNGYKLSIFGSAIPFINFNIKF